jgi:NADH dehydrogenase/putative oxidoreductase
LIAALLACARFAARATSPIGACFPIIDLLIRLWLAQLFWMSGLASLADWQATLSHAAALATITGMHPHLLATAGTGLRLLMPPLLLLGLATRLAALPLLALAIPGAMTGAIAGPITGAFSVASGGIAANHVADAPLLWALLATWYVTVGAGALSLDALIARGIYHSALPFAPAAGRALAALSRAARPAMLLLLRAGIATVLLRHGMVRPGPALLVPALLATGFATRLAVLPLLAATGAATMHAASNEHVCWMLLLLLILAAGPGVLSLDALFGAAIRRAAARRPRVPSQAVPRVVIVGGGFAGATAARALRHAPCDITLVDRHNYHLFQPLLYQVATASLSPADIATPIRALFRDQPNVRVLLGEVTAIDTTANTVMLDGGASLPFTFLIVATGARHAYFGHDDWEETAPGLKTLDDATLIRRRILLAFERAESETDPAARRALLTFGVIGGGPTGVELAGAIAELARHGLKNEFRSIDPAEARVLLIQAGDRVLPTFPPALSTAAAKALQALGVEVLLGGAVEGVDAMGLSLSGQRIPCATAFWAAGVAASPAATWLGAPADRAGRLCVAPDLTVPGHANIFAVGDTATVNAWNGMPVPGLAPAAKQQGAYVAHAIRARLAGKTGTADFRYSHAGSLATIGRRAAVADFGRVRLKGPLAWWLWGAIHILFLAGTRNRLVVGIQWFWAYLTFGRGIRLITSPNR